MHYANGREAKNGDSVVMVTTMGSQKVAISGILFGATPGNDTCNGNLASVTGGSQIHYANLSECLHAEDVLAAAKTLPDTSKS